MILVESNLKRSRWDSLVEKMAHESQGDEGYIGPDLKAPLILNTFFNRFLWFMTIVYFIWYTFFVGDQIQAFIIDRISSGSLPGKADEQIFYYQDLYSYNRPHTRKFV